MSSVNKVILIGWLGRDPEVRYTANDVPIANFSLATNEYYKNSDGERQESTEWHRVVVFGKQAESCSQYLSKGRQVYIEGSLQTREWENKEGEKRITTEVVARQVTFLGGKDDVVAQSDSKSKDKPMSSDVDLGQESDGGDDDLPF